jgi:hypothetical protein
LKNPELQVAVQAVKVLLGVNTWTLPLKSSPTSASVSTPVYTLKSSIAPSITLDLHESLEVPQPPIENHGVSPDPADPIFLVDDAGVQPDGHTFLFPSSHLVQTPPLVAE